MSSLQDPKPEREERLFSMQLISQENPATEINRFDKNGPEWLVPGGTPFAFGIGQDFKRERGKWPIGACLLN